MSEREGGREGLCVCGDNGVHIKDIWSNIHAEAWRRSMKAGTSGNEHVYVIVVLVCVCTRGYYTYR